MLDWVGKRLEFLAVVGAETEASGCLSWCWNELLLDSLGLFTAMLPSLQPTMLMGNLGKHWWKPGKFCIHHTLCGVFFVLFFYVLDLKYFFISFKLVCKESIKLLFLSLQYDRSDAWDLHRFLCCHCWLGLKFLCSAVGFTGLTFIF